MSIDDKLREILLAPFKDTGDGATMLDDKDKPNPVDQQIAQIKAVFADEGYQPHRVYTRITKQDGEVTFDNLTLEQAQLMVKNSHHGCMTGKEWLSRFEKELNAWKVKDNIRSLNGLMVKSLAKKAAGLTDDRTESQRFIDD